MLLQLMKHQAKHYQQQQKEQVEDQLRDLQLWKEYHEGQAQLFQEVVQEHQRVVQCLKRRQEEVQQQLQFHQQHLKGRHRENSIPGAGRII